MYNAYATGNGWEVYREGTLVPIARFERLAAIVNVVNEIGGRLTIIINGVVVN